MKSTLIFLFLFLIANNGGAAKGTFTLKLIDIAGAPVAFKSIRVKGKGTLISNEEGVILIEKAKIGKRYEIDIESSELFMKSRAFSEFQSVSSLEILTLKWNKNGWQMNLLLMKEREIARRETEFGAIDFSGYESCDDSTGKHHELYTEFPGGNMLYLEYMMQNLTYPELAIDNEESGKVVISFRVTESGDVADVKVEKSISESLDDEALLFIQSIHYWVPAYCNGEPISTRIRLPVLFSMF